jgi:hypothetical protein
MAITIGNSTISSQVSPRGLVCQAPTGQGGGQVMIFTHHRHLVDLAQAALGEQALALHSL